MTDTVSCYECKHRESFREYESWEMSHIWWWVHLCHARPSVANLRQFPFHNTTCESYERANENSGKTKVRRLQIPA